VGKFFRDLVKNFQTKDLKHVNGCVENVKSLKPPFSVLVNPFHLNSIRANSVEGFQMDIEVCQPIYERRLDI
jgi:hypothetical protein